MERYRSGCLEFGMILLYQHLLVFLAYICLLLWAQESKVELLWKSAIVIMLFSPTHSNLKSNTIYIWFNELKLGNCALGSYCLMATRANNCSEFRMPLMPNTRLQKQPFKLYNKLIYLLCLVHFVLLILLFWTLCPFLFYWLCSSYSNAFSIFIADAQKIGNPPSCLRTLLSYTRFLSKNFEIPHQA